MTGKILSYSAGSTSRDPYKYRVIDAAGPSEKLRRLVGTFDQLQPFFVNTNRSLVVDAYPAALGGLEAMTRVVTYLHSPTCARALELAALEGWRAIFVAQPLAGADLLLRAVELGIRWPHEMLWATGGYPLPKSLESFVRQILADHGCQLSVLQAYGIAELDHTLLAAMHRDEAGRPVYHLIDQNLQLSNDQIKQGPSNKDLTWLYYREKRLPNHDRIMASDSTYRIGGDPARFSDRMMAWLNAWQPQDWDHFTGYFVVEDGKLTLQQRHRPSIAGRIGPIECKLSNAARLEMPDAWSVCEMSHFNFVERYLMSWLEKPTWCDPAITQQSFGIGRSYVAAAA